MSAGSQLDFSKATPISQGGDSELDFSQAQPLEKTMSDEAHDEIRAHPGGVKQWLTDLESDLRYGGTETVIGRGLKKMGYQAPESLGGEGGNAGKMIVSPLTGTTFAAHGVAEAASGHPLKGAGEVLSGIGEASELPMQFIAPEEAEAATAGATRATKAVTGAAARVKALRQEAVQGERITQPGTQAAVRGAISKASGVEAAGPIIEEGSSIVDDHLATLASTEKSLYSKMDKVAGFDVKAERAQLANDQYKLRQLGNTDADIAQRGKLIESINDSTDRIKAAETQMKEAGVDPGAADAVHKQRMAGKDFKKMLVSATNADGTVNLDKLAEGTKKLRFSKFGDRVTQYFGDEEAANEFEQNLQKLQKMGAHAVKSQRIAKWLGAAVGLSGLAAGVGGVVHAAKTAAMAGGE